MAKIYSNGKAPGDRFFLPIENGIYRLCGIDVIAGLRGWTTVPIIVLSARTAEAEKGAALDAGANAYVSKPFGMAELVAALLPH